MVLFMVRGGHCSERNADTNRRTGLPRERCIDGDAGGGADCGPDRGAAQCVGPTARRTFFLIDMADERCKRGRTPGSGDRSEDRAVCERVAR